MNQFNLQRSTLVIVRNIFEGVDRQVAEQICPMFTWFAPPLFIEGTPEQLVSPKFCQMPPCRHKHVLSCLPKYTFAMVCIACGI
ncbi:hypothetical protein RSOLAG1IB_12130 [Rhizoctonia solani AG-1 IB]|uniref:Uncharacterized protein n=1 Tax=Thanatephorus cucumeris (strain AG1-IB / isolate 7/3/14) TaxID=1108050 RepID=A0A0B7FQN6_THACB|nr:hypothetical protein RSOLAG1IB_12130 [Rhizoctonia solani AG-1 IB]